ncbi:MAG TPA: hypothetical protein VFL61_06195 [Gaiellaceae bacterium]|nr:hypothetical protein [Gaiellaceae bacterium]
MLDRKARLNVATFVPAYTLGSASPIVAFKFDGGGRNTGGHERRGRGGTSRPATQGGRRFR